MRRTDRLPALDGLRGLLALGIVGTHVGLFAAWNGPGMIGTCIVGAFFVMSSHVLARSYEGPYWRFLWRRLLRLGPVLVICWLAGALTLACLHRPITFISPDVPVWSMTLEWAGSMAMPLLTVIHRRPRLIWLGLVAVVAACFVTRWAFWMYFFVVGAAAQTMPRIAFLERPSCQWLGKISYSLYLSHWVVLLILPVPWAAALIIPVAWAVWFFVERPSILWSRRGVVRRLALAT